MRADLNPVNNSIQGLAKLVDDTYTAIGSDIINDALEVYSLAKANEEKIAGLKPIVDKMRTFFPRRKRTAEEVKK